MAAMARSISIVAAFVLLLAVAGSAGGAPTPHLIVFQGTSTTSFTTQLFSIQPTGGGVKQLTTGSNAALQPAFSPSGQRVAFARFGVGLFTMNPDGSGLRRLTTNGRDSYPTWAPNGSTIAFVRPLGPKWHVYVVSTKGGKPKQLPQTPPAGRPSWTKAGLLIPTGGDVLRIDSSTGKVLKYYGANVDAIWGLNTVALSPALSMLTYVGSREPESGDMECGEGPCQRFGLYQESLKAAKKKPRLIVKDAGPAGFSPDGARIVFVTGGALVLRSVGSGASTTVDTGDVTPTTAAPPTWR
jgi:dipeptidyl aminopeptidase/acylaminoacyl peptidase